MIVMFIFTICTNQYNEYLDTFVSTIHNFYPDREKHLVVFTDRVHEKYDKHTIGNTYIETVSIPNLFYGSLLYNKMTFIEWYCKDNNITDDTIVYFWDIDTLFYENTELGQTYLDEEIKANTDKVIFPMHPIPYVLWKYTMQLRCTMHGFRDEFGDNNHIHSKALDDFTFYENGFEKIEVMSSFYVGALSNIKKLNEECRKLYNKILANDRIICQYFDEDLINYILLEQYKGQREEKLIHVLKNQVLNINHEEPYSKKNYDFICLNLNIDEPYLLVNQKFFNDHKKSAKTWKY